ncbi:MAG: TIGR02996 domain-containing protein [Labilithrix sp.]
MPNVKNRRIVVDEETYRWSSIGDDGGIGIAVRLEAPDRGTSLVAGVPHRVLVLPSLIRRLVQEARAAGWNPRGTAPTFAHELQGPFLDAPDRRKRPRPEPVDHDEHLAAIRAAPDDDAPRLVYADWLLERGDPRGELIVLQCGPRTEESRRREAELLREHELQWLGAVAYVTRTRRWRRGFVVEAELTRRERGVVAPAIGDERWWSIRVLDARGAFLDPLEHAQIVAGAGFDDLDVLKIEAEALEHLLREGDGWVPRLLEIHPPGPVDFAAIEQAARAPRLRELRLFGLNVTEEQRRSLERPTLSVSC